MVNKITQKEFFKVQGINVSSVQRIEQPESKKKIKIFYFDGVVQVFKFSNQLEVI